MIPAIRAALDALPEELGMRYNDFLTGRLKGAVRQALKETAMAYKVQTKWGRALQREAQREVAREMALEMAQKEAKALAVDLLALPDGEALTLWLDAHAPR